MAALSSSKLISSSSSEASKLLLSSKLKLTDGPQRALSYLMFPMVWFLLGGFLDDVADDEPVAVEATEVTVCTECKEDEDKLMLAGESIGFGG